MEKKNKNKKKTTKDKPGNADSCYWVDPCGCYSYCDPCGCMVVNPCCC